MSSGFQIEMRLVAIADGEEVPKGFLGVGGYQVSPEAIRNPDTNEVAKARFHMVADELFNRSYMVLSEETANMEDIKQEEVSADQIHHMSELVRAGKYVTKAFMRTYDDGSKELTFTLSTDSEVN